MADEEELVPVDAVTKCVAARAARGMGLVVFTSGGAAIELCRTLWWQGPGDNGRGDEEVGAHGVQRRA